MSERIQISVDEDTLRMFASVFSNLWQLDRDFVIDEETGNYIYTIVVQNIEIFLELATRFKPRYLKVEKQLEIEELIRLVRAITLDEFTYFSQTHLRNETIHHIVFRAIEPNLRRKNLPLVLNQEFITDILTMDDLNQFVEKYPFRNFGLRKFQKLKELIAIILTSNN